MLIFIRKSTILTFLLYKIYCKHEKDQFFFSFVFSLKMKLGTSNKPTSARELQKMLSYLFKRHQTNKQTNHKRKGRDINYSSRSFTLWIVKSVHQAKRCEEDSLGQFQTIEKDKKALLRHHIQKTKISPSHIWTHTLQN